MEANVQALQKRAANLPALARYDEIAQLLTGKAKAKAVDAVCWVKNLGEVLKVRSLAEFGLKEQYFQTAVEKSRKSSSMKGNPIKLTESELLEILKNSL
jgi:alcohol dehydrogenase class IV